MMWGAVWYDVGCGVECGVKFGVDCSAECGLECGAVHGECQNRMRRLSVFIKVRIDMQNIFVFVNVFIATESYH